MKGVVVLEKDGDITGGHVVRVDDPAAWAEAIDACTNDLRGRTMHCLIAPDDQATFPLVLTLAEAVALGWTEASHFGSRCSCESVIGPHVGGDGSCECECHDREGATDGR